MRHEQLDEVNGLSTSPHRTVAVPVHGFAGALQLLELLLEAFDLFEVGSDGKALEMITVGEANLVQRAPRPACGFA
jgi:hypothetical protein